VWQSAEAWTMLLSAVGILGPVAIQVLRTYRDQRLAEALKKLAEVENERDWFRSSLQKAWGAEEAIVQTGEIVASAGLGESMSESVLPQPIVTDVDASSHGS
jgi:hypothetical protein